MTVVFLPDILRPVLCSHFNHLFKTQTHYYVKYGRLIDVKFNIHDKKVNNKGKKKYKVNFQTEQLNNKDLNTIFSAGL